MSPEQLARRGDRCPHRHLRLRHRRLGTGHRTSSAWRRQRRAPGEPRRAHRRSRRAVAVAAFVGTRPDPRAAALLERESPTIATRRAALCSKTSSGSVWIATSGAPPALAAAAGAVVVAVPPGRSSPWSTDSHRSRSGSCAGGRHVPTARLPSSSCWHWPRYRSRFASICSSSRASIRQPCRSIAPVTRRTLRQSKPLLALVMLGSAALVAGVSDRLAAVLVTLAVVTIASLGIVEPATTAAAGLDNAGEFTATAIGAARAARSAAVPGREGRTAWPRAG